MKLIGCHIDDEKDQEKACTTNIIAISVKSIELAMIRLRDAVRITPIVGIFRFSLSSISGISPSFASIYPKRELP